MLRVDVQLSVTAAYVVKERLTSQSNSAAYGTYVREGRNSGSLCRVLSHSCDCRRSACRVAIFSRSKQTWMLDFPRAAPIVDGPSPGQGSTTQMRQGSSEGSCDPVLAFTRRGYGSGVMTDDVRYLYAWKRE